MLGLSTLGFFHTVIGLVAVVLGFWALARDKEISLHNRLGQSYLVLTLITAATGLGIFQRGAFGPPHVLSLLTLAALAVGTLAGTSALFGRASRYVQVTCFSATILFHMIPGFVESLTRLPVGAPVAASPEAPVLQGITAALLAIFLAGLALQLRWLRARVKQG